MGFSNETDRLAQRTEEKLTTYPGATKALPWKDKKEGNSARARFFTNTSNPFAPVFRMTLQSSEGKDINAIWAKLKADNQPKRKQVAAAKTSSVVGQSDSGTKDEDLGKLQETSQADAKEAGASGSDVSERLNIPSAVGKGECSAQFKDVAEAEALFARTINALTEDNHVTRRSALNYLASSLRTCEEIDLRTDVFVEVVAKPLLRRFADKNEKCRELAILTLLENIEVCKEDAVESLLAYCFPVLQERLNLAGGSDGENRSLIEIGAELLQASHVNRVDIADFARISKQRGWPLEPSEEVRLLLVKLLRKIMHYGSHVLKPYAQECCEILLVLTHDPFHEILLENSKCLKEFADVMGNKLWMISKILLAAFALNLSHRRQAVRVAVIEAISPLVFTGAHESLLDLCSFRDPNVVPIRAFFGNDIKINYMGKLITDSCVKVRRTLVRTVGSWMLELPERRDHESRLLPYVLSGLIDEDEEVQSEALQIIGKLGELYIYDNAEDMKDKLYYLPDEAHAHGWMDGGVWKGIADGSIAVPKPFRDRPALGVRLLVQQNFKGSLTALSKELSSWQEEPRLKAAKLLRIFLVCMEDYISSCLEKLLPALCQARITEDKDIIKAVMEATQILSWYTDPSLSLSLLKPRLSDSFEIKTRESALSILTSVVRGSDQVGTISGNLEDLAKFVHEFDLTTTNDSVLKRTTISFCVAVFDACWKAKREEPVASLIEALLLLSSDSSGNDAAGSACSYATETLKTILGKHSQPLRMKALRRVLKKLCEEEKFLDNLLPELHVLSVCKIFQLIDQGGWCLDQSQVYQECQEDLLVALNFFSCALDSGPAFLPWTMQCLLSTVHIIMEAVPTNLLGETQRASVISRLETYVKEHNLDLNMADMKISD